MTLGLFEKVEHILGYQEREKYFHFSATSYDIWNKFYNTATVDTFVNKSREVIENNNVFVDYVCFQNFDSGVIRISSINDSKVLISTSSFYKCSSANNGGCISCSNSGSCVQYKVSDYKSKIQSDYGSHSYITMTDRYLSKNFVIESSFDQNKGRISVLYNKYVFILFSSINISNSNLNYNAAFISVEPYKLSANFSNFIKISSIAQCVFWHGYGTQSFSSSNVIDNKVTENGRIFANNQASLTVNQCFFKGSSAATLFLIAYRITSGTTNECHFGSDNTFQLNGNIQKSQEMTEIILSNLFPTFLCIIPTKLITTPPAKCCTVVPNLHRRH
ncbi:hypothetical protein TVAG_266790 [Trichomonas vaginalis G3]|uniref:Right handed beta helix domain-containing protein n=1 Tax=Trichomonas vaginalis (strain ATCC PRA-98 / G3) TaxID=412133 RepID=A2DQN2_TRIV3|nr:hypothetical protein TVAGG3_0480490 [Trichomonas vaginalis G3]EAY17316.1 hypothetical protein TVAG_266790 [Trichomonas vaginalis G3]KAI5515671.1 hypothetical protein TVAGG3_0480490 [Trichomonas vaginalis G3]|eukprot:XP_001329539.1 hypothetical protein [Trichomonas vaginalis G3]